MTTSTDLGAALEALIREHEYCGDLDGGGEGDRIGMSCTCGRRSTGTLIVIDRRLRLP